MICPQHDITAWAIEEELVEVDLTFKQVLYGQGSKIEFVYFIDEGVASLLQHTPGSPTVEIATTGREGMVGISILLGDEISPDEVIIQIPGHGRRMKAATFMREIDGETELRAVGLRFTQALISQIAQNAACNRIHNVEERAARWLLMTHDRVSGDTFPLTQEFLAVMLGVRRQAVNVAAGMLQQAGLISYVRGVI